ncbi:hypothetical protein FACS189463_1130 [Bacteroidia bacterium]|nr:hypothetical protein FACS189463_1130 [Bacteroidia bacterium]
MFAERRSIKDRSENWLQSETSGSSLRGGAPTINPGTDPTQNDPSMNPIGDALPWLILLATGYMVVTKRRSVK